MFPLWAAIVASPALVLALLVACGALSAGLGVAALIVVATGAWATAVLWRRDFALVEAALLRGGLRDSDAAPPSLRFAATAALVQRAGQLSRTLADRTAEVERLLRAEGAIVERLPDPLILLDADRSVHRANAAARTAFGADIAAVLRHPGLRAAMDRALSQGTPQTAELTLSVPIPREVRATLLALDLPMVAGGPVIAVLSDCTRERAVERMRADFVANASHELRTPLASLIGFIDTMRGPAADDVPAQRRFLGIMSEQAQRMNRLIDDLLSLSRIELMEHQPPADQVKLGGLVRRVAAAFEPRVAARRMALELRVPANLPCVAGDADQLAQVLQNLLDNAVKYGREAGVVRIAVLVAPPGGRWPARAGLLVAVSDDGPGIAREHLARLTERFYRVDKGRSQAVGGTGLGLSIVRHIVNRHRGVLVIESEEGAGATFTIWLPEAAADHRRASL